MNWEASTALAGSTSVLPTVVVAPAAGAAGAVAVLSGTGAVGVSAVVPVVAAGSVDVAGAWAFEPLAAALHSAESSASGTVPAGGQFAWFCISGAGAGAAGVASWA